MTMELADADAIFEYPHAGGRVAGAGDIDGDGLDDLLLGDKYRDPARTGGAYVVLSPF